jgi:hypothetical protein
MPEEIKSQLTSQLFKDDNRLKNCLKHDWAHVTPGSVGDFVSKIQIALFRVNGLKIDPTELAKNLYGPSTAAAVLHFKTARQIINPALPIETQPDNIVGKRTITALDNEEDDWEKTSPPTPSQLSGRALALQDVPLAQEKLAAAWVAINTHGILMDLEATRLPSGVKVPFDPVTVDALEVHFHLIQPPGPGKFPGTTPKRLLGRKDVSLIQAQYLRMALVLSKADTIIQDMTAADRATFPDAPGVTDFGGTMRFGPMYRVFDGDSTNPNGQGFGPNSRAAMVLHESVHVFDSVSWIPNFIHISEFDVRYDTAILPDNALHNPSAYATFAAHIVDRADRQPRGRRFGAGDPGFQE